MARAKMKINRELLTVFMESPFYFTIPVQKRLAFIKFFSQQSVCRLLHESNPHLKKGKSEAKSRIRGR